MTFLSSFIARTLTAHLLSSQATTPFTTMIRVLQMVVRSALLLIIELPRPLSFARYGNLHRKCRNGRLVRASLNHHEVQIFLSAFLHRFCQHRWQAIAGMVGFRNQVGSAPLTAWVSPSSQQIAFARGTIFTHNPRLPVKRDTDMRGEQARSASSRSTT